MYIVIHNKRFYDFTCKENVGFFSTKEKAEEVCNFINSNIKSAFEAFNKINSLIKDNDKYPYGYQRYDTFSEDQKSGIDNILKDYNKFVKKYFESRVDDFYLENSFAEIKEFNLDSFDFDDFII